MSKPALTPAQMVWILVTVGVVSLIYNFELTAISLALPHIAESMSIRLGDFPWVINVYGLTFMIFLILGGYLADRYGRRKIFMIGLVIFALGSLLGGVSMNFPILLVARFFQGLGIALAYPVTLAIAIMSFGEEKRAFFVSVNTAVTSIFMAIGPFAGGIIIKWLGWRWLFFLNVPLCGVAIILALFYLSADSGQHRQPMKDYFGLICFAGLMVSILSYFIQASFDGWFAHISLVFILLAIFFAALLFFHERKMTHPFLPLDLLKNKRYMLGITGRMCANGTWMMSLLLASLYLQNILHYCAQDTGTILLPLSISISLSAFVTSYFSKRMALTRINYFGLLITLCGIILLFYTQPHTGWPKLVGDYFVLGIGIGIIFSGFVSIAVKALPENRAAVGMGFFMIMPVIGVVFASTLSTTLLRMFGHRHLLTALLSTGINLQNADFHKVTRVFSQPLAPDYLHTVLQGHIQANEIVRVVYQAFLYGYHHALFIGIGFVGLATIMNFLLGRLKS